jgi:hypothetical protein
LNASGGVRAGAAGFTGSTMNDLLAALCLVLVLEGLLLFVAPEAWKRAAERLLQMDAKALRQVGGLMIIAGLIALQFVR